MNKNLAYPFVVAITIVIMIAACSNNKANKNDNSDTLKGEIKIDGSSTVFLVTEAIAEEFRKENPDVKVTIGISGTGGGFKKFARGESDISDASRMITENEKQLCKENEINFIELKVAFDGLAVIANPENDWLESITVEELKKLWHPSAQDSILKWNQIRPEWPNEEIHLFGSGVASGTYDFFTQTVVGESGSSRGDFTASEDDNMLVHGIAGDKFGLGFFGLAYYEENKDKLKLIAVGETDSAYVYPTAETVSNGTYPRLSRPLYIYVSGKAAKRKEVVEFVRFYLDKAPMYLKEVGYIKLNKGVYKKEKERFEKFIAEVNSI